MKKWSSILFVICLLIGFLAGCGGDDQGSVPYVPAAPQSGDQTPMVQTTAEPESASIIGTWKYRGALDCTYTFEADGNGVYRYSGVDMPFTYTDDGKVVSILYPGNTEPTVLPYTVSQERLSIEDSFGTIVEYDRVSDPD